MAWLLVAFLVVPFVELYLLIQVGQAVGAPATIAIVAAVSLLGSWLVKREGIAAWRRLRIRAEEGQVPGREIADGALILLAGVLLLTPGFLSDALGLLLLVPPTRAVARGIVLRRFAPKAVSIGGDIASAPFRRRAGTARDDVIDV